MVIALVVCASVVLVVWLSRGVLLYRTLRREARVTRKTYDRCTEPAPSVSVVVPARNEEENLPGCLDSLLAQDYPDFEVIVVNDRSDDRTAAVVESYARRDSRVRLVNNLVLPEGWTGRNHALEHGARDAQGEFLLFTDADVIHASESLSQAVTHAVRNDLDMLSLLITLRNETFWQRLLQPIACLIVLLQYRLSKVNDPRSKEAMAMGGYILVRREAYNRLGGRESVRGRMMDLMLARRFKEAGLRVVAAQGAGLAEATSPGSFAGIWRGWTRILICASNRSLRVMVGALLHLLFVDVMPTLMFLGACAALLLGGRGTLLWTLFGLSGITLAVEQILSARYYRAILSDPKFAFLRLAGCLVLSAMLIAGAWSIGWGRSFTWKGQCYCARDAAGPNDSH